MPVSTLRCSSCSWPLRCTSRATPRSCSRLDTAGVRPIAAHQRQLLAADGAEHEDRRLDAGAAHLGALLDHGDAQPVDAGGFERPRHHRRAVAVGVGLDDAEHAGAADAGADARQVGDQRVEVDLAPRRAQRPDPFAVVERPHVSRAREAEGGRQE